jgi:hypothetical protein
MLEWDGKLYTWALDLEPFGEPIVQATSLPLHRIEYLDYQGPISGNRGTVTRTVAGHYRIDGEAVKLGFSSQTTLPRLISTGSFRLWFHHNGTEIRVDFLRKNSDSWELQFELRV